jgi:hypothetical protein
VTQRPYLVFVRAGTRSLHPQLLAEDPSRNWDCAVSWYAEPPPGPPPPVEYESAGGFNKFDGFLEFWRTTPEAHGYRYYLVVDDDVYFQPGDVSRFLSICDRHGTALSQPALSWTTHFNLNVTLANPVCRMRHVNFVEVMAPCFSGATLVRLMETFPLTRSTWGLDIAWSRLIAHEGGMYVVDEVRVEHTKVADPTNGAFYQKLRAAGVDPVQEAADVQARYGAMGRKRTLGGPHTLRGGLPSLFAPVLVPLFERVKLVARIHRDAARRRHRKGATT